SAPRRARPPWRRPRYRRRQWVDFGWVLASAVCIAVADGRARRFTVNSGVTASSGGEMRVFRAKFGHLAFRRLGANIQGMFDKDPRGGLSGVRGGKIDAILPRNLQRLQARLVQIFVQDA